MIMLLSGCDNTNEKKVEYLGGKAPVACVAAVGSGSDEEHFTTCRDAAGVIFVCNRDTKPDCIRVVRVQAVWSAGLPEVRP